jgi:MHS family proline/betaine transporter-like MFS transporter
MTLIAGRRPWQVILAATLGNALEWYDFIVFGFMAATISKLFFPQTDPGVALLLATLSVGVGFIARPLGAVVLGLYADRAGRKPALTLVIGLMFAATAMIAFAPTYAEAGLWAAGLIVIARLIQGFSTGGEFGSATAMLIEYAPDGQRGLYGSWQMFAQASGALVSTLMGALLFEFFSQAEVENWAWRIPFLFGLLIGPVGLYIRLRLPEPEAFRAAQASEAIGLIALFAQFPRQMTAGFAVSTAINVMSYVIITYLPLYAQKTLGLPQKTAFQVLLIAVALRMALVPVFGALSDRVGRKPVLAVALGLFVSTIYPAYAWVIAEPGFPSLLAVELWFALLIAAAYGPAPAYLSELFPIRVRATGLSIVYNLAATIFGGFSLTFVLLIEQLTGSRFAPAHYAVGFFLAALLSLLLVRETRPVKPDG